MTGRIDNFIIFVNKNIMKILKAEAPQGDNSKIEKQAKAVAGCFSLIVGLVLFAFITYSIYIFVSI